LHLSRGDILDTARLKVFSSKFAQIMDGLIAKFGGAA
jgi:hypothetical protein